MKTKRFLALGAMIAVCATILANTVFAQGSGLGSVSVDGNWIYYSWQYQGTDSYQVVLGERLSNGGYYFFYNWPDNCDSAFCTRELQLNYIPTGPIEFWLYPNRPGADPGNLADWAYIGSSGPAMEMGITETANMHRSFTWKHTGEDWYRLQFVSPLGFKAPIPGTIYDGWVEAAQYCQQDSCNIELPTWFWIWFGGVNLIDPHNPFYSWQGFNQGEGINGLWMFEVAGWQEGDGQVVTFLNSSQLLLYMEGFIPPVVTNLHPGYLTIPNLGNYSAFRAGATVNGKNYVGTDVYWEVYEHCLSGMCYIPSLWGTNQPNKVGTEFILALRADGQWEVLNEVVSEGTPQNAPGLTITDPGQLGVTRDKFDYFYIQALDENTQEPVSWARMNTVRGPGAEESEPGVYSTTYCAPAEQDFCPVDSYMGGQTNVSAVIRVCGFNDGEGIHADLIADGNSVLYDRCSFYILDIAADGSFSLSDATIDVFQRLGLLGY